MKFNRILSTSILAFAFALPASAQPTDLFCVGLYELRDGRYRESINSFSRILRSNPRLSEAYFYRGLAHYIQKRYPEALANYNQALSIGISTPKIAVMNRASALGQMGDYGQAIEDLKLMLQMSDSDDRRSYDYIYRAIAYSYLKLGNRSAAITWLQKLAAKYYSDRRGSYYLQTRDIIEKVRAGGTYQHSWDYSFGAYEYSRRCAR